MDLMRLPVEPACEESGVGALTCQEEMEGGQVSLLTSRPLTQCEATRCHNRKHRLADYLEILSHVYLELECNWVSLFVCSGVECHCDHLSNSLTWMWSYCVV